MSKPMEESRIILALDVDTVQKAVSLMDSVGTHISMVKIGLEAINAQIGGSIAAEAYARGYDIFWDGKFDDIPATIAGAAKSAVAIPGVQMFNVHANADVEGLMAAAANKGGARVLVVTKLTSQDTESVELNFGASRNASVLFDARMAAYAGCDGIVCSPKELAFLRKYSARDKYPEVRLERLIKVVPGTRSPGVNADDQKNIDTPENAVRNGADWLVIGREITKAKDPAEAAFNLNRRIAEPLRARELALATAS